jgi:hypothetical protein
MRRALIALCFIAQSVLSQSAYAAIDAGSIGEIKGSGVLERGKDVVQGNTGVGVMTMDTAVTARGTMRIDFIDETRVDITEHSRLLIDEFVYDPANNIGSLSIKATLGGVRYASGQIAKKYRQNVKIKTPSATIGVRGTDFVMVVDEMGGSMITLLPSCDTNGNCYTGEIEVETDAGFIVMNQAFQSTMTSHRMQPPSPPIIIDENEKALTQLIILRKRNPYEEEEHMIKKRAIMMYDFLGIDFLEFDGLDSDLLNVDDIWITALDENDYILGELLYDVLDQLNAALMAIFKDELSRQNEQLLKQEDMSKYGFDPETGIRFDKTQTGYHWTREDNAGNNYTSIKMNESNSYSLNVQQGDWATYDYRVGNSIPSNNIDILQRN